MNEGKFDREEFNKLMDLIDEELGDVLSAANILRFAVEKADAKIPPDKKIGLRLGLLKYIGEVLDLDMYVEYDGKEV